MKRRQRTSTQCAQWHAKNGCIRETADPHTARPDTHVYLKLSALFCDSASGEGSFAR